MIGDSLTVVSFAAILKDRYRQPGDPIKQYVLDENREWEWERATCPRFNVDPHDRPGCELHGDPDCAHCHTLTNLCPNEGETTLLQLRDTGCDRCNELYEASLLLPSTVAWLAEKAARPPIEQDRSKLSDQVEPERPLPVMHTLLERLKLKP